jgi:hypothetical protein
MLLVEDCTRRRSFTVVDNLLLRSCCSLDQLANCVGNGNRCVKDRAASCQSDVSLFRRCYILLVNFELVGRVIVSRSVHHAIESFGCGINCGGGVG